MLFEQHKQNHDIGFILFRVPECSFLKGIKWSNQTILVHNLAGLIMYQTGSRLHLDMKQLLRKLSPRLSLNLGDFCFSFSKFVIDHSFKIPSVDEYFKWFIIARGIICFSYIDGKWDKKDLSKYEYLCRQMKWMMRGSSFKIFFWVIFFP